MITLDARLTDGLCGREFEFCDGERYSDERERGGFIEVCQIRNYFKKI